MDYYYHLFKVFGTLSNCTFFQGILRPIMSNQACLRGLRHLQRLYQQRSCKGQDIHSLCIYRIFEFYLFKAFEPLSNAAFFQDLQRLTLIINRGFSRHMTCLRLLRHSLRFYQQCSYRIQDFQKAFLSKSILFQNILLQSTLYSILIVQIYRHKISVPWSSRAQDGILSRKLFNYYIS